MQEQVNQKIRYVGDQLFLISNGGLFSQLGQLRPQAVHTRRPWKFAARLTCGVLKVGSMGEQLLLSDVSSGTKQIRCISCSKQQTFLFLQTCPKQKA